MAEPNPTVTETGPRLRIDADLWLRRICALVVAAVAAYASYQHQRVFALSNGGDHTGAKLWPLSVDGLLLLATLALLKAKRETSRRARAVGWAAFLLGIVVSLAANISAAPVLTWQAVLVAGWPPVALLLAVELLTHTPVANGDIETASSESEENQDGEIEGETKVLPGSPKLSLVSRTPAKQIMWEHYVHERERGHTPTGAELDRVAGTNNYGNRVLRAWHKQGRV
jgi:hypothetical protein